MTLERFFMNYNVSLVFSSNNVHRPELCSMKIAKFIKWKIKKIQKSQGFFAISM
jgi:hypothetical protein